MADFDIIDGTPFYKSPYIFVRNDPAEAWDANGWPGSGGERPTEGPHQNPKAGQDNALYVRVDQIGDYVTSPTEQGAQLHCFAGHGGPQFIFNALNPVTPAADWANVVGNDVVRIHHQVGPTSTDYQDISTDLPGPDSFRWYRFLWKAEEVPPPTSQTGWHPCLLAKIVTDETVDSDQTGDVQGDDNFAQLNISVVEADKSKKIVKKIVLGNQFSKERRLGVIVTTAGPAARGGKVILRFPDGEEIHNRIAVPKLQMDRPLLPARLLRKRMPRNYGNPHIRDLPPVWAVKTHGADGFAFEKHHGGFTIPVKTGELVPAELTVEPGPQGDSMQVRITQYGGSGRVDGGVGFDFHFK
jgi:hypothetical protein